MGANKAEVDLVLIQPFHLYFVNHVVLMLTIIFFSKIFIRKEMRFVSKHFNLSLTFTQRLGYQAHNCKMVYYVHLHVNKLEMCKKMTEIQRSHNQLMLTINPVVLFELENTS